MPRFAGCLPAFFFVLLLLAPTGQAAVATVGLGTAETFAVLAGSGITNTGTTTIQGDVGSHPTPTQTGFGTVTVTGTNHHDDAVTEAAKADLLSAYTDARDRTGATPVVGGELGGQTLGPGVYADDDAPDSLAITGTLTLDGGGNSSSVFIFQSGSTLITATGSKVVLVNGAQSCNVFWQVTSSATLGTGSQVQGNILAQASITLGTGATVNGSALALDGAVTMAGNTIRNVPCAPLNVTCAPTAGGVEVTWDPVADATSYNVYRSTGSDPFILLASGATSPYEDTTAASGQTYTYKVTAVAAGAESDPSATCTSVAASSFPVGLALGLAAAGAVLAVGFVLWRRRSRR
jgi:type VI secretion system secreted protein VgrG